MSILEKAKISCQQLESPKEKPNPDIKFRQIEEKNRVLESQMKELRDQQLSLKNKQEVKKTPVKKPNIGNQINYARLYKDPNLNNFDVAENRDIGDQEQKAFELVKNK